MPKDRRPGSGKDRGSLTQKADDQDVRISQVSNVSAAVSAMGKETTRRMQETDRRIAEGGDTKEVSGSMNGVLHSLKKTVDSLEKGVQVATLGTAKAAQDAIKQYGAAISEDFKIQRSNMVASSMAAATPLVGYFASKLLETGILKKTKDSISEKISGMFKKKDGPDDFGMNGMNGQGAAASLKQSKEKAREEQKKEKRVEILKKQAVKREKKATMSTFTEIFKKKHKEYDEPADQQMLLALNAIRDHLVRQEEKEKGFEAWAKRSPILSLPFKPIYWFFKARGGYKRFLSKANSPLTAINQNIGTTFLQMMPRLDALIVFTRATAEAVRDLSTHTTRKTYPRLDASKLGDTWSIAGSTWKAVKFLAKLPVKAMAMPITKMLEWAVQDDPESQKTLEFFTKQRQLTKPKTKAGIFAKYEEKMKFEEKKLLGKGPFAVGATAFEQIEEGSQDGRIMAAKLIRITSPKMLVMAQQVGVVKSKARGTKLLEGPGDVIEGEYTEEKKKGRFKNLLSKIRMPKYFKGMGKREKPHVITQGVYDLYKVHMEQEKNKKDKKKMGMFAKMTKFLKQHDEREKRRSVWGFFGGILKSIGGLLGGALGFLGGVLGPIMAALKLGAIKFIKDLFIKGGAIRAGVTALMSKAGPIAAALTSPWVWGPIGAALLGAGLGTAINEWLIKPWMDEFYDRADQKEKKGTKTLDAIREKLQKEAKGGSWEARVAQKVRGGFKAPKTWIGGSVNPNAVFAGQMKYVDEHKSEYAKYSVDEIQKARTRWQHSAGYFVFNKFMSMTEDDPEGFGYKKEAAFLEYLKEVGTPSKAEELEEAQRKWKEKVSPKKPAPKPKGDAGLISTSQIEKLAKEYNIPKAELIGKTVAEATAYAQARKEQIAKKLKESPSVAAGKEMLTTSKDYWKAQDLTGEKAGIAGLLSTAGKFWEPTLQKTQEYVEVAKGTYVPIYRQGKAGLKEMWESAAPEKKAMMKREIEAMLASGEITAAELKRMGVDITDATKKAGKDLEHTVQATGVYTTNNISESMAQTNVGGGGGNQQKFLQERSMDDVQQGRRLQ